jgi:hypothetical protein
MVARVGPTDLVERVRLDLRELVFHVVRVHGANLIPCGRTKNLDNLDKLIDTGLAREQWLSEHELCHYATGRPHIWFIQLVGFNFRRLNTPHTNLGGVVRCAEDQLGCAVVSGADVRHIGLVLYEDLCAAEIAKLEDTGCRVQKQVLRLDVSVADPLRVDVGEGAEKLVDVELDLKDRHDRLHLVEVARSAVDSLGDELEHEVQVDLVLLQNTFVSGQLPSCRVMPDVPARRCCRRKP